MYSVILFYKYVSFDHAEIEIVPWQRELAEKHHLQGRVLVGDEGINGTLAGTPEDIDAYIHEVTARPDLADIDFKKSESEVLPFPKLKVKYRPEIVTLGLEQDIDMQTAPRGTYLDPDDMEKVLQSGEEYYIIDARNNYEAEIGKFKNAITFDIENFREIPEHIQKLETLKKKKVIFYCTGGVRCEKLTAYAIREGFEDVYQLHGGIQRYAEKYPKGGWEGAMYIFDNRVTMVFDKDEDRKILTSCMFCGKPYDSYKNCFNAACNKRMICCDDCYREHEGCCSDECRQIKHPRKDKQLFEEKLADENPGDS